MTKIYQKKQILGSDRFYRSERIVSCEYCADSGKLMTEACKRDPRGERGEVGYFVKGSEPTDYCDIHIPVLYDVYSGGVDLQGLCAKSDYVGMICIERNFPIQIYVSDAQYVWKEIPEGISPETSPYLPFFNNILGEGRYFGISNSEIQFNRLCRAHYDYFKWQKMKKTE